MSRDMIVELHLRDAGCTWTNLAEAIAIVEGRLGDSHAAPDAIDAAIQELARAAPRFFRSGTAATEPAPAAPPPAALPTGFRVPPSREQRREDAVARALERGNPWSPVTKSITAQALLTSVNPDLATKLQHEAKA